MAILRGDKVDVKASNVIIIMVILKRCLSRTASNIGHVLLRTGLQTHESWDKESVHTDVDVCLSRLIKQQDGTQQESEDQNSYSKPTWCYGHV